mgnify:CR=1 FL=1
MRFTQEQIDQAKQVPVERIAKSVRLYSGQERKIFSLEEMDSLMELIQEKICGGDIQMEHMETVLTFLIEFANYSFQQAVKEMFKSCKY